ncbi:cathepsin L [Angomonas deanei]|nr:cathepsin L [Angomonas deanei]|eukprot:EPY40149.1 cathepsin L [Angomonas deanei]
MTDWTTEEFLVVSSSRRANRVGKLGATHVTSQKELPFEIDYRTQYPPILTNIKNQGNCGSCWAHSAVEAIESHWAIATGNLHVLSQQQLTSCTPNPDHCGGSGGCSGSVESLAFDYVKEAGGLVEEWLYPYTSYFGDSGTCKTISTFDVVAKLSGFVDVPKDDQNALMDALAFKGPIAVSVDASHWSSYSGGIFDGCSYAKNITQNHAVQLVGYGHDVSLKKDYWIIRNSWGPLWGENGYMRLLKTDKPECGWDTDTHSGAACDGDPDEEWVCGMCGILSGATYPVVDVKQK